ncbi:uracil-DNA glycosylase [Klebsiella pneumoniae]|uniref:Uracil-DNA glycosylase n=1 Tax=Klebsiella pneumoniae TaxID=573 RepID=A0A377TXX0_KLEPN|nr:uracil-DNA glycosylase [Klebsiella pneumoniae]
MTTPLTWHDVLADEKQQPYFLNTLKTVAEERQSGITIYPPQKDVFNAFRFTELGECQSRHSRPGPLSRPGSGPWSGVLSSSGRRDPAFVAEYV